jgi:hypothetical protein
MDYDNFNLELVKVLKYNLFVKTKKNYVYDHPTKNFTLNFFNTGKTQMIENDNVSYPDELTITSKIREHEI